MAGTGCAPGVACVVPLVLCVDWCYGFALSFEAILKDTDLLNLNLKPTLSRQAFLKLSKQMKLDVKWLRENNIMDCKQISSHCLRVRCRAQSNPSPCYEHTILCTCLNVGVSRFAVASSVAKGGVK